MGGKPPHPARLGAYHSILGGGGGDTRAPPLGGSLRVANPPFCTRHSIRQSHDDPTAHKRRVKSLSRGIGQDRQCRTLGTPRHIHRFASQ